MDQPAQTTQETIKEPRLWRDNGWTARVIKNPDDEGWAVEMILQGQTEPALVGPWTMGRDKKNPKPLDTGAFTTLVKTASEVIRRHEQAEVARLHKQVPVDLAGERWNVLLRIVPDEDEPHALLSATNRSGDEIPAQRVRVDFKLTSTSALAWAEAGFQKPR